MDYRKYGWDESAENREKAAKLFQEQAKKKHEQADSESKLTEAKGDEQSKKQHWLRAGEYEESAGDLAVVASTHYSKAEEDWAEAAKDWDWDAKTELGPMFASDTEENRRIRESGKKAEESAGQARYNQTRAEENARFALSHAVVFYEIASRYYTKVEDIEKTARVQKKIAENYERHATLRRGLSDNVKRGFGIQ